MALGNVEGYFPPPPPPPAAALPPLFGLAEARGPLPSPPLPPAERDMRGQARARTADHPSSHPSTLFPPFHHRFAAAAAATSRGGREGGRDRVRRRRRERATQCRRDARPSDITLSRSERRLRDDDRCRRSRRRLNNVFP